MIWILLAIYLFHPAFVVYAGVTNNWNKLRPWMKAYYLPIGVVFGALDIAINFTIGSVLFLQLPSFQHVTLTRRMVAIKAGPDGWRKTIATWICGNLCDVFQIGHC